MMNSQTTRPGSNKTSAGTSARARVLRWVRSPEFSTELLQVVKCVVAGALAWWLAVHWQHSPMPFLAPWTALLTVQATVYRSLAHGVQMTVSSAIGVVLSFLIGNYLGVDVWTIALALFIGMGASYIGVLRREGVAIATTALFVLGGGSSGNEIVLLDRLEEVALGVAIGIVVNLMLIPPVRHRQAARYVDNLNRRMGKTMIDMAGELSDDWDTERADAWLAETVSMDDELESAWQSVRFARESSQWNPLETASRLRQPSNLQEQRKKTGHEVGYEDILQRVGEGTSHLRHLVRTIRESTYAETSWDDDFRTQWSSILRDAGRSIADPDADVEPITDRLDSLAEEMSEAEDLPSKHWPVYGSMITTLTHIAKIVDDVASTRRARESEHENPRA